MFVRCAVARLFIVIYSFSAFGVWLYWDTCGSMRVFCDSPKLGIFDHDCWDILVLGEPLAATVDVVP